MSKARIAVAALTLSASALIGLAVHEGYRGEAYTPVPGDKLTIGFGDTHGVQRGEKTDPVRALIRLGDHVERFQHQLRECIGDVPMYQHEWDAAVKLTYNIGPTAFCNSTAAKRFKAGDYAGACEAFLMWNKFRGKVLPGLVKRREQERALCLGLRHER